ncbi:MAG: hypothetical protein PHV17_04275 [Candidatus Omnitrophica bacterium]|nr:hypothetical protein [Candidatus Omnitrophota bacterium]
MNQLQLILFVFYFFSLFLGGMSIYSFINRSHIRLNRALCIGESLLLGSILVIGELFSLSFFGLYKNPYLWGMVCLNYVVIFNKNSRKLIKDIFISRQGFDVPSVGFIILILILIFRNLYFLIDVDSLSTYLFTQRLWVEHASSFVGQATHDMRIFVPQFDAVPYSLGISVFGQETLFPHLINLSWRIISALLVFGYTKYRLNSYYALAASAFIVFNDHFFYSGANQWVVVNAAVIALIFAAVYNFWEAKSKNSTTHLVLALIFTSQLLANKYYLIFTFIILFVFGLIIQYKPLNKIKEILKDKNYIFPLGLAFSLMILWYLKNYIVTGDFVYPLLSGRLGVFDWTLEQQGVLAQLIGSMKPLKLIKYISFLFIWPGVIPAKYVLVCIFSLPLVFLKYIYKKEFVKEEISELCFWVGASILILCGLCFAAWQDPRAYRFPIGVFSFTSVLFLRFSIKTMLNIKKEIIPVIIIIVLSFQGCGIIYKSGVIDRRPTIRENIDVALNKIHMDYIIEKHHSEIPDILDIISENKDKIDSSAWFTELNTSAFLLPDRPRISLFCTTTTTVKWDSYAREDLIIDDLREKGIEWVMMFKDKVLVFVPIKQAAEDIVKFDRFPKKTMFDYGFPEELTLIY